MGSSDWFKTIISFKKVKEESSRQAKGSSASGKSNGFKWKNQSRKESASSAGGNPGVIEDLAATRIQTAFRAYLARKTLRCLKGATRLQILTQNYSVKKQATTTLNCLHTWSKIQAQIRARRQSMVTEGRLRQKKLENQLKLEAKLHDLEVEWCGGSVTMEEILARIHQREEAAVKRERTMAYAFSHQWRANSSQNLGLVNYELGKANWGWSWMERWIAARPWESRIPAQSITPKKVQSKQTNKAGKNTNSPTAKTPVSSKPSLSNGKGNDKARRLSYPAAEKGATLEGSIKTAEAKGNHKARRLSYSAAEKGATLEESIKTEEAKSKGEQLVS
ncbi:hypothetical protein P3X46_033184 [Hevea brasiliensis]|uniref:DUF4005 domain-containing protein n=1 Tax=Hevea brasiliensis TaxID=3981 RepID=A0ABQ9KFM6_HEVBR|nr:protein IQ-DOMAIN 9 [Hevea brasiliensis]XP_021692446.1 protein IQ-DOMAIN 9 [Hevea brasiliensis]XP_021692447.1 protein IQ-DOMAIN 9 [Hevea brasiliensis]KAJ9136072.1 hypothetical protein P3X46_033184 [Hevea brasiliensis]